MITIIPQILATPTTDAMTAYAAVATAAITLLAVIVAWWQLSGLRGELRMTGLMAVLEIESQMSDRKVKLEEMTFKIVELKKEKDGAPSEGKTAIQNKIDVHQPYFDAASENYLNAVDRLCYCILNGYLADRDWRAEYRNLIHQTIEVHSKHFGPASPFRNIKKLEDQWQST